MGLVVLIGPRAGADGDVERIVSLAPSVTEILFALGVGDRLVGVSSHCDYPPEVGGIDRIGTFLRPNVERILVKKPHLVIAVPSPGNRWSVEALQNLGLRVLVVDPDGIGELLETIRAVAGAVGVPEAGRKLVEQIERRMAVVKARLAGAPTRSVIMLVGRAPLIAVGPDTYQDELIRLAGGENLTAGIGEPWPHVSLEYIITRAPEVIIDAGMGSEESADAAAARGFWQKFTTIPAVRDGRIHGYRAYELLRPGPRVADTLETIARYIHPERFAPRSVTETGPGGAP